MIGSFRLNRPTTVTIWSMAGACLAAAACHRGLRRVRDAVKGRQERNDNAAEDECGQRERRENGAQRSGVRTVARFERSGRDRGIVGAS